MIKSIQVSGSEEIICPALEDGRILKYKLKQSQQMLYVCEECEASWLNLHDMLDENKGFSFMGYLRGLDLFPPTGAIEWSKIIERGEFVLFDEVKDIVEKHSIERLDI